MNLGMAHSFMKLPQPAAPDHSRDRGALRLHYTVPAPFSMFPSLRWMCVDKPFGISLSGCFPRCKDAPRIILTRCSQVSAKSWSVSWRTLAAHGPLTPHLCGPPEAFDRLRCVSRLQHCTEQGASSQARYKHPISHGAAGCFKSRCGNQASWKDYRNVLSDRDSRPFFLALSIILGLDTG
jgi:hypothetical protein